MKSVLTTLSFALGISIAQSKGVADNEIIVGETPLPLSRYKLDGDFSDWKTYTTGWAEKYIGYENFSRTPRSKGVAFKGGYYDNDEVYLYLFFKCTPTPQKEIDRYHAENGDSTFSSNPFSLGSLWVDIDLNKSTGSKLNTKDDKSKAAKGKLMVFTEPRMVTGAEFCIKLGCGMHYLLDRGVETGGHFISYSIKTWNHDKVGFEGKSKEYKSYDTPHLIQHGKHGIEMAIPLSEINLKRKQKFSLTLWEDVTHSSRHTKNIVIDLK